MQNTYLHGEIEILYVDGTAFIDICEKEASNERNYFAVIISY